MSDYNGRIKQSILNDDMGNNNDPNDSSINSTINQQDQNDDEADLMNESLQMESNENNENRRYQGSRPTNPDSLNKKKRKAKISTQAGITTPQSFNTQTNRLRGNDNARSNSGNNNQANKANKFKSRDSFEYDSNGDQNEDDQDEQYANSGHYEKMGQQKKLINKNSKSTNGTVGPKQEFRSILSNGYSNQKLVNKSEVGKSDVDTMNNHTIGYEISTKMGNIDIWGHLLVGISYFFLVFAFPFSLCACIKIAQEFERAVVFRLGRILSGGAKGPGIFFVLPCIDTYTKVDLRTVTFDVPPQEILTKDSVTVSVDAVVYFRIFNAVISVINVEDAAKSTKLLAASTLRNILGTKSLHEILSDRESVAILIQNNLDEATGPWGVKVERVEVKDVRLPVQLQRAMATEAEAAREARAKVIAAEGEQKASKALKEAAEVISESPIAIQLRYLQTLTQIASEKNSTIVFPIPLEMLSFLANKSAGLFKLK